MSKAAREFYVLVDGVQVQAWVAQDRQGYRAWGDYRGKQIVCSGRSEGAARAAWQAAADYASKE